MPVTLIRPTPFGPLAILWAHSAGRPKVTRILIPHPGAGVPQQLRARIPPVEEGSCRAVDALAADIRGLLAGESRHVALDLLGLDTCPPFQQAVLRALHGIPRGQVISYQALAALAGAPRAARAARAVGNAMATNPFPIVIPCHRVICSDGRLGEFGGGPSMKRALLRSEGVARFIA